MKRPASRGQAIFLGTTEPRAARPEGYRPGVTLVGQGWPGGVKRSVKYADIACADVAQKILDVTVIEVTGGMEGLATSASPQLFSEWMR
jgi:hypothetical protein